MKKEKGLSARELFKGAYAAIKNASREIKLPQTALAEIADDSDFHRTRVGYSGYDFAVILKLGDKEWAISLGTACGAYPADPYNCDIVAVQVCTKGKTEKQLAIEIMKELIRNSYFCKSLIIALADGRITLMGTPLSQKIGEILGPKIDEFIAKEMEINPKVIHTDLRPVVTSAVEYEKAFVPVLCDAINKALAS